MSLPRPLWLIILGFHSCECWDILLKINYSRELKSLGIGYQVTCKYVRDGDECKENHYLCPSYKISSLWLLLSDTDLPNIDKVLS